MAVLNYSLSADDPLNKVFLDFLKLLELDRLVYQSLQNELGLALKANVNARFSSGTDPDGAKWKKSQRAEKQGGDTLKDTGILNSSITYALGGKDVTIGTNVPYAPYLHFGATIKPLNGEFLRVKGAFGWFTSREITLPAREFLGFGETDKQTVSDVIETFLNNLN